MIEIYYLEDLFISDLLRGSEDVNYDLEKLAQYVAEYKSKNVAEAEGNKEFLFSYLKLIYCKLSFKSKQY